MDEERQVIGPKGSREELRSAIRNGNGAQFWSVRKTFEVGNKIWAVEQVNGTPNEAGVIAMYELRGTRVSGFTAVRTTDVNAFDGTCPPSVFHGIQESSERDGHWRRRCIAYWNEKKRLSQSRS